MKSYATRAWCEGVGAGGLGRGNSGAVGEDSNLLFPSFRTGKAKMLTDFRQLLRKVAKLADPPIQTRRGGKLTPKIFRHTYCTTRCQTVEHGVLIDRAKVAKELGHAGTAMVRRVYDHLGTFKPLRVMEYRLPKTKATARRTARGGRR